MKLLPENPRTTKVCLLAAACLVAVSALALFLVLPDAASPKPPHSAAIQSAKLATHVPADFPAQAGPGGQSEDRQAAASVPPPPAGSVVAPPSSSAAGAPLLEVGTRSAPSSVVRSGRRARSSARLGGFDGGGTKDWPWTSHPDIPAAETDQWRYLELTARFEENRRLAYALAGEKGWEMRLEGADGSLAELVGVDDVGHPVYRKTFNVNAAISTGVDLVREVNPYASGGALTGSGFRVGVWDSGRVRIDHREFSNRVVVRDGASNNSDHATHVAGTIGASGVDVRVRGMVPAVGIDSYDWLNDFAEMAAAGARSASLAGRIAVSNHSYGRASGWERTLAGEFYFYGRYPAREDESFGKYLDDAVEADQTAFDSPFYLIFVAVGNDRDNGAPAAGVPFYYFDNDGRRVRRNAYISGTDPLADGWDNGGFDTIGSGMGTAKNVIAVGAVNDAVSGGRRSPAAATMSGFSGWGPTDDGRIKPDLVANGVELLSPVATSTSNLGVGSGTSMASPNAAGTAMLLQQLYSRQFGGEIMRASRLKALLIHTADDLGRPGPDYVNGWGLINAKAAADVVMAQKTSPAAGTMVDGELSASRSSDSYTFNWSGNGPITATIVWTDPAGSTVNGLDNSTRMLVNDLDIRLTGPVNGNPFVLNRASPASNATTGDNTVDNVEQIRIASPTAGAYTLRVSHKGTLRGGRQAYSLILTGQSATTAGPVIALAPASLTATGAQGGANPAGQTFTVRNTGTGTLNYTISDNASWLAVNPASGSATTETDTINVSFVTTGLAAGVYNAQITVQSASGGAATIPVQLTVTSSSVPLAAALDIATAPASTGSLPWTGQTSVTHDGVDAARSGAITHNQETGFALTVTGPGVLTYYAKVDSQQNADLLRFEIGGVVQDTMSGNVNWTDKQFTIPPGIQTLRWRYNKDGSTSSGADAAFVDQVLYVQGGPEIGLRPERELAVTVTQGANAAAQSFSVSNTGLGSLSYTVSDDVPWMSASPAGGTSTGESDTITITFNTGALAAGTYTGNITVSGGANVTSRVLPVRLTVNPASGTVTFAQAVDYAAVTWIQPGGGNAAWIGQTLVTRDGIDAGKSGSITHNQSSRVSTTLVGPGNISFWWKVDSESNWDFLELWINNVKIQSISGNVNWSQVTAPLAAGNNTVEFRYTKDISINVGADAGWIDQFTFNGTRPPLAVAAPVALALRGDEQSPTSLQTSFTLSNSGGGTFEYAITESIPWLTLSASSGSVTTETDTITVSVSTSSLRAGSYSGSIRVNAGAAGILVIPVSLQVTPVLAVPVSPTPATPYAQNFSAANLPTAAQGWTYYSDNEGRIGVVNGWLRMDDSVPDGATSLNEAILHVNLQGKRGAILTYLHREYADEDDLLPQRFTGRANGDGVSISVNGTEWHRIDTLSGAGSTARSNTINLDAVMSALGLSYTSTFQIKFQQYDNYPVASDGFEFDDIRLSVGSKTLDDHGDTLSTATPAIIGAATSGRLEVAGDTDYFRVIIPEKMRLMAFTTGTSDTMGSIHNSSGAVIATNNDATGLGLNFFISTELLPGTYFVSVRGSSSATGGYALNLQDAGDNPVRPGMPDSAWQFPTLTDFNPLEADWILYPFEGLVFSFFTPPGTSTEQVRYEGEISLAVTGTALTGNLSYRGTNYPLRGSFGRDTGTANITVPRPGATPVSVSLEFKQINNSPTLALIGTVGVSGQVSYAVLNERLGYAPRAGRYTFLLPADPKANPRSVPGGDGHATMLMRANGQFTLAGRMGDGTVFTESGNVTTDGFFHVYNALYPGGWLAGDLKFRYLAGVSDADGIVQWYKPARSADKYYRSVIDTWMPMIGSSYLPPATAAHHVLPGLPVGATGATASFGSGEFFPSLGAHSFAMGNNSAVNYSGPAGLTLRINRADGSFSGTIRQPYTGRTFPFFGVTFQRQNLMSGYVEGAPFHSSTGFISIE